MQGERIPIPMYRNENNHTEANGPSGPSPHRARAPLVPVNLAQQSEGHSPRNALRSSIRAATRKLASYACAG